jgi:DtxR family Mn-dependent transcriptional regulator
MRLSISKEDYLKAIAEAESEGEEVSTPTIVRWLDVSAPAASMALKRLHRDGLVETGIGGSIRLKPEGRQIAETLLRRHHLLERMLSELFEFEWYKVHEEAERLEHAISDDFEKKLAARFGHEESCPHGNRLGLDTPGNRRQRGWLPLSECPPGRAVLRSVFERDRSLLEHLDRLQLRPGTLVAVGARNWDDTLTLEVNGAEVMLGVRAAELVWVEPVT